jgi:hypothetical protein
MKIITRIVVFILLLVVLNLLGFVVVGYISGLSAPAAIRDPTAAKQAAHVASEEYVLRYFPAMAAIFTLLSALIAFGARLRTFLIAGSLAVGIFCYMSLGAMAYKTRPKGSALQTTTSTPAPLDRGATAQQRAIQLFPDLGVANSRLNQEFLRLHNQYQKDNKQYFADPEWPTKLAQEANEAIKRQ